MTTNPSRIQITIDSTIDWKNKREFYFQSAQILAGLPFGFGACGYTRARACPGFSGYGG
jgi:hypothetical protein